MIKPDKPIAGANQPRGVFTQWWDWINSLEVYGDGKTIFAKKTSQGICLSAKPFTQEQGAVLGGGASSSFTLFEVVKGTDTSVKINGYNTAEGRYSRNLIILGLTTLEIADATSCTGITATGKLYLSFSYSSGWVATLQFAASLPAQDITHIYWELATIVCVDSKVSQILQPPTGVINLPMRAG